ncbi:accessory gland protein [Stylonychia lemnae]|uniref:Accessory gland protein n=1 Tax=Stylonychia lemnae TaxID=5949 RepID=A0A078B0N0_STYLE|nr:accessory gland protein [Stylonychia lemnae]|eukprot:CDW88099.1 accessory gland protein [Stylonychia lemnae]
MQQRQKPKKLINQKPTKSIGQALHDQFKQLDWFGQTIKLTYKGEDSYKTTLGASVSFILILLLLGFSIFKTIYFFSRFNPDLSKVTLMRDMRSSESYRPQETGFDFAFGLNSDLDPRIGYFTVKQIGIYTTDKKDSSGKAIKDKIIKELKYQKCGDQLFDFPNQQEILSQGISNYNCLTDNDYQFQGNYFSDSFQYLEIKLWKCQNNTKISNLACLSDTAINSYLDSEFFNFAFVNTFYDLTDFEPNQQIKPFIDDSLFFEIESSRSKKNNFYIQQQEAQLEDDFVQFGQSKNIIFHQVSNNRFYDNQYKKEQGYVVAVFLRYDNRYDVYERKIYSLLELLGDIGGLQGALMGIGFLLVGFISSRMFISDIMHKIYQVRKYIMQPAIHDQMFKMRSKTGTTINEQQYMSTNAQLTSKQRLDSQSPIQDRAEHNFDKRDSFKKKNLVENNFSSQDYLNTMNDKENPITSNRSLVYKTSTMNEEGVRSIQIQIGIEDQIGLNIQNTIQLNNNLENAQDLQDERDIKVREHMSSKQFKKKQTMEKQDVQNVLMTLISRMRFKYNTQAIFQYISRCLCLKHLHYKRNKKFYKNHYLYQKGEEKLRSELDIISLLKTQRKLKLLTQTLLSQKHRMLLRFQRQNVLETASESSDSDDDNLDTMSLMENKNPLIRLVIFGKLKKMMKSYEGQKLKSIDRNLMRGIFQRKLKDFQEELIDQTENKTLLQRLHGTLVESTQKLRLDKYNRSNMMRKKNPQFFESESSPKSSNKSYIDGIENISDSIDDKDLLRIEIDELVTKHPITAFNFIRNYSLFASSDTRTNSDGKQSNQNNDVKILMGYQNNDKNKSNEIQLDKQSF